MSASLGPNGKQQFNAIVSNSLDTGVVWSLSAAVGTISNTGLYTAPATLLAAQSVTVRATSAADPTKVATATVSLIPAVLTVPIPGTALSGSNVTFTWNPVTGASAYWLDVGPAPGVGSYFGKNVGFATSQAVAALPTDGTTICVRLWAQVAGVWQYSDYTYTAAVVAKAVLTTPTPGTPLSGSNATFIWNAATGASAYWLISARPRVRNIFGKNVGLATARPSPQFRPIGAAVCDAGSGRSSPAVWQYNDYLILLLPSGDQGGHQQSAPGTL